MDVVNAGSAGIADQMKPKAMVSSIVDVNKNNAAELDTVSSGDVVTISAEAMALLQAEQSTDKNDDADLENGGGTRPPELTPDSISAVQPFNGGGTRPPPTPGDGGDSNPNN